MADNINKNILILGASSISNEVYNKLAIDIGDCFSKESDLGRALNPSDTSEFVKSVEGREDKDVLIYQRAIKCVDDADFIIVDISSASTGMGLEVGYLLSGLAKSGKSVCFIAKEGSKISPHIAGMYKSVTGKDIEVGLYDSYENMIKAVTSTSAYKEYINKIYFKKCY